MVRHLPDFFQVIFQQIFVRARPRLRRGQLRQNPKPLSLAPINSTEFQTLEITGGRSKIARPKIGVRPQRKCFLPIIFGQIGKQKQHTAIIFFKKSLRCQSQSILVRRSANPRKAIRDAVICQRNLPQVGLFFGSGDGDFWF